MPLWFPQVSSDAFAGRVVQLLKFGRAAPRYDDVRTLGRFNVNTSVQKALRITEGIKAQFSAEASNVLNNTHFRPAMNAGLTRNMHPPDGRADRPWLKAGTIQNVRSSTDRTAIAAR